MIRNCLNALLILECGGGGTARHVIDLYKGLRERGWNVTLIVSLVRADEIFINELSTIPKTDVITIPLRRNPHPYDLIAVVAIWRHLRNVKYAIVHAHSTKAGLIGAMLTLRTTKKVFTPHAYRGMDVRLTGLTGKLIRGLEGVISRSFDRVLAVSDSEFRYALSIGVARNRLRYIPNGVDVMQLRRRMSAGKAEKDPRDAPVIGFVGRLVYQKNPMVFLRAFCELSKKRETAKAVIIGDGEMLDELKEFALQNGMADNIRFMGAVDAVPLLLGFDVFVHTSRYESLPYVLLEAAAAQIPIVAVSNAGSRAVLAKPERLISDPEDFSAIAAEITRVLTDRAYRNELVAADYEELQRFTVEAMCEQIDGEYRILLKAE